MIRFAAVGLDHAHIFDHVRGLLAAGAQFAGYCPETTAPELLAQMQSAYPDAPQLDREAIFDDPGIAIVCWVAARAAFHAFTTG